MGFVEHGTHEAHDCGACTEADDEPEERRANAVEEHEPQDLLPGCTESETNADLAGALRDQIGEHAVKSRSGKQKSDDREGEHENGVELRAQGGFADRFAEGDYVRDREVRIEFADDLLDRHGECFNIVRGADDDGGNAIDVAVDGPVDGWIYRLRDTPPCVADHTDHLIGNAGIADLHMPADGILVRKTQLRGRLVDDDNISVVQALVLSKDSSLQE